MSKLPSKRNIIRVGVVAHICNLSTLEAEAEESLTTLGCTCEAETGIPGAYWSVSLTVLASSSFCERP